MVRKKCDISEKYEWRWNILSKDFSTINKDLYNVSYKKTVVGIFIIVVNKYLLNADNDAK